MGTGGPLKLPRLCNPTEACADGAESASPVTLLFAVSEQCQGTTPDGTRCSIRSQISDTGLCVWHDPARKDEADELRKKGQAARTPSRRAEVRTVDAKDTPGKLTDLDDLVRWAAWTAKAVATGKIDARTARETAYALTCFRGGLEKRDLARDLAKLRSDFDEFRKGRRSLKTA